MDYGHCILYVIEVPDEYNNNIFVYNTGAACYDLRVGDRDSD